MTNSAEARKRRRGIREFLTWPYGLRIKVRLGAEHGPDGREMQGAQWGEVPGRPGWVSLPGSGGHSGAGGASQIRALACKTNRVFPVSDPRCCERQMFCPAVSSGPCPFLNGHNCASIGFHLPDLPYCICGPECFGDQIALNRGRFETADHYPAPKRQQDDAQSQTRRAGQKFPKM